MQIHKIFFIVIFSFFTESGFAQHQENRVGFYFQPFYSAMFLENHIGNAVGFNMGITTKNKKWNLGIRYYGRSGPINLQQEYELALPEGQTYKDKSVLQLGADHGYLGLEAAYQIALNSNRLKIRIPFSFGQLGAGFYLKDDDRDTPDGRRVNEWEDELQNGTDAGFGLASEIGIQVIHRIVPSLEQLNFVGGLHYLNTYGYESFLGGDDFYNNKLRASIGISVGF